VRIAQKEGRRVNGVRRLRREKPIEGVGVLGEGAAIPLISLVSGLQVSRQLIPWKPLQKSLDLVAMGVAPTPWSNVSTVARGFKTLLTPLSTRTLLKIYENKAKNISLH